MKTISVVLVALLSLADAMAMARLNSFGQVHQNASTVGSMVGKTITIFGVNFGTFDSGVKMHVANHPCVRTVWIADSSIRCIVPPVPMHISSVSRRLLAEGSMINSDKVHISVEVGGQVAYAPDYLHLHDVCPIHHCQ